MSKHEKARQMKIKIPAPSADGSQNRAYRKTMQKYPAEASFTTFACRIKTMMEIYDGN